MAEDAELIEWLAHGLVFSELKLEHTLAATCRCFGHWCYRVSWCDDNGHEHAVEGESLVEAIAEAREKMRAQAASGP